VAGSALARRPFPKTRVSASAIAAAAIALLILILTIPTLTAPAPEMDEGALLAYPERVLAGDVPHRDFETFYGPGSPWLLAGVYEVFGPSLATERVVGVLYRLLIIATVFGLALPWGRLVAAASGLFAGFLLLGLGATAHVSLGGLGLALLGLLLTIRAGRPEAGQRTQGRLAIVAGLFSGAALLFRFDLAPAVVLPAVPLLTLMPGAARRRFSLGLFIGVAAYIPHLLIVGPDAIDRVVTDLIESGPGRRLPLPGLLTAGGRLFVATVASAALFVVLGVALARKRRRDHEARAVLAIGLFLAALLPFVLSRADTGHILSVGCAAVGLLPVATSIALRELSPPLRAATRELVAVAVVGLVTFAAGGWIVRDRVTDLVGLTDHNRSVKIEHEGRFWRVESARLAHEVEAMLSGLEQRASGGDSLFVGPRDLRRSNHNDTFIYHLMPRLEPASYFMELNPSTANRRGSGLARDLERADFLVLAARWDRFNERNESSRLGPAAPNAVVRARFCLRVKQGSYELYERCR
jgi:hypothetical protein